MIIILSGRSLFVIFQSSFDFLKVADSAFKPLKYVLFLYLEAERI